MNKVIIGLIAAVCVLGMALVMLNERLGRKTETQQAVKSPPIVTEQTVGLPPEPPIVIEEREGGAPLHAEMTPAPEEVGGDFSMPPARMPNPEEIDAEELEMREARDALAPPRMREPEERDEPKAEAKPLAPKPRPKPQEPPKVQKPEPPKAQAQKPEPPKTQKPESPKAQKPEPPKAQAQKPEQPKTQAKPAQDAEKSINRFVIFARENGATVRMSGNGKMEFKSMTLDNPDRVVIDIDGEWSFPPNPGIPKNDLVSNVRVGKNGDKTRVVIDLKEKPRSSRVITAKNGDSIDVRVDK